jgi:multidrug transporter EmrE-like cation transporter
MMKASNGFTRLAASGGVAVCFLAGAVLLTIAVSRGSLGTTYVIGLGLEAVVTFAFATLVLGEGVSLRQVIGVAVATTGLMLLG